MQTSSVALAQERRQSERALISIAVRLKAGDKVQICQASDISTQGIFLANVQDDCLPRHGKCWLEFSLPGSTVLIAARGEIVRQHSHAKYRLSAIRFAALAPSHRRLIWHYVQGPPLAAPAPAFLPHFRSC